MPGSLDGPQGEAERRRWNFRDAESRFGELARLAREEGPQRVAMEGADDIVVLSSAAYRRLRGERSGRALVDAFAASPHRDLDIEPERFATPVRPVEL